VQLVIEDEEVLGRRVLRVRGRLEQLLALHLEELGAVRLVHGQEGGRHAAGSGEELAPADSQLLAASAASSPIRNSTSFCLGAVGRCNLDRRC
jgi:hypothetical protein